MLHIEPAQMTRLMNAMAKVSLPQPVRSESHWPTGPCSRLGRQVDSVACSTCSGTVSLKVYDCTAGYGRCSPSDKAKVRHCSKCPDRRTVWPMQYDERNLWPGKPGLRFNASIAPFFGGYVIATRSGWRGSEINVGFLNDQFWPVGESKQLALLHEAAAYGREDPRLFWHNGKLHVCYVGVMGGGVGPRHTNALVARLKPGLEVEEIIHPHLEGRNLWEKNHAYFSHEGRLYCVYSITPHRVHELVAGKLEPTHETENAMRWNGGVPRGGAPPVRVGDEYWHFFHDRIHSGRGAIYRTALYTFEAKPPFRPLRYIPEPILVADPATKPTDQYCSCVFVGGAVRVGPDWVLAHGIHDRWTQLHKYNHADLESKLVRM